SSRMATESLPFDMVGIPYWRGSPESASTLAQKRIAGFTDLEANKLCILDAALMRRDETSIGRDVERMLVTRGRPKCAGGRAHHTLIGPRNRRALTRRVDPNDGLFRMGGNVERPGQAKGEVITKDFPKRRPDLARG